ncbi:hypothetical protein H4R19_000906 [Coemansia spiralis]|nr:hypothetical protein H4R19_000906 [Coemansia spiralis]
MASPARLPELLTESQKAQELRTLRRRARYLDKKWTLRCRKPDGITVLSLIPVVGGATSAFLAFGYLQQIRRTFELPHDIHDELVHNILYHTAVSVVPFVGCITRRARGINKQNFKVIEVYVMAVPSAEEKPAHTPSHSPSPSPASSASPPRSSSESWSV